MLPSGFVIALSIGFVALASYFDLRYRVIPRKLTLAILLAGITVGAVNSISVSSFLPLAITAFTGLSCFIFAYSLYSLRVWAGGDAKLFGALGFLLPSINGFWPVPFYALAFALLASVPFVLGYAAYHLWSNQKLREHVAARARSGLRNSLAAPLHIVAGLQAAAFAGVTSLAAIPLAFVFHKSRGYGIAASGVLVILALVRAPVSSAWGIGLLVGVSILFLLARASFSGLKQHVLRDRMPASKLEAGMILARDLRAGSRIIGAMARGLTRKEVLVLRKAARGTVEIRRSLPFTPVYAAGYALFLAVAVLLG